jgi:hypothetical protein
MVIQPYIYYSSHYPLTFFYLFRRVMRSTSHKWARDSPNLSHTSGLLKVMEIKGLRDIQNFCILVQQMVLGQMAQAWWWEDSITHSTMWGTSWVSGVRGEIKKNSYVSISEDRVLCEVVLLHIIYSRCDWCKIHISQPRLSVNWWSLVAMSNHW